MTTDFSKISRTGGSPPPQRTNQLSRMFTRRNVAIGAIVLALVLGAVALLKGGGDDGGDSAPASEQKIGTVHGPARFTDGIPSGYTHDQGGATTAAVNIVQALAQASPEQAEAVRSALVAANPSPALVAELDLVANPSPTSSLNVLNAIPATATVLEYVDNTARVSVWTLSAGRSTLNAAGQQATQTFWSTSVVTLVWEGEDWRASDVTFSVGPSPQDADAPSYDGPGLATGYYSFFVN